jgi:hypothetical protein
MRYLLLLGMVLCALFTTAEAWACKCARGGDASPLVANAMSGSVVVVRMETVDVDRGVATVTVEEHWDGPTLPKRLTVVGADGGNCNASLAGMPKGSRWIMVLQLDRPTPGQPPSADLNGCGVHHARVEGNHAVGQLDAGVGKLDLPALKARINKAQAAYKAWSNGN